MATARVLVPDMFFRDVTAAAADEFAAVRVSPA
jgi:hypothetical protein